MRYKNEIRCIDLDNDQLRQLKGFIMEARNSFIQTGKPTEDINELLINLIKLQKRRKIRIKS